MAVEELRDFGFGCKDSCPPSASAAAAGIVSRVLGQRTRGAGVEGCEMTATGLGGGSTRVGP